MISDDELRAKGVDALTALRWCHERRAWTVFDAYGVRVHASVKNRMGISSYVYADGTTLAEAVYAWVKEHGGRKDGT